MKRIFAAFQARVREVLRDRSALAWNFIFAPLLVIGAAAAFAGRSPAAFDIATPDGQALAVFAHQPAIQWHRLTSLPTALQSLRRQTVDAVIVPGAPAQAWINVDADKSRLLETLLQAQLPGIDVTPVDGTHQDRAGWLVAGLLGLNIMFSSLFAIGHVIVRYRKSGYLKRLKGTPLRTLEFLAAQMAASLLIIVSVAAIVFAGCVALLDIHVVGSDLTLLLVATLGALAMIAMSLLISARINSEELSGALLNVVAWPMVMLSGAFFSIDKAPRVVHWLADALPLTPMLRAARAVMLDGASLNDVAPQLLSLAAITVVFVAIGVWLFRWTPD